MLDDLESAAEISRLTEGLLQRADAAGHWPTRVDDIVAAAKLEESTESPFDAAALARAPSHLRKAVELLRTGRVRAALDRRAKTIHLNPAVEHSGRRDFIRLHETAHDLFPWQGALAYADDDHTLSSAATKLFEREANQGAAEMFFQGTRFTSMARDYRTGADALRALSSETGASLRATLRRYAETHHRAVCGIALEASPSSRSPLTFRRREVSQSAGWTERFGVTWPGMLTADVYPWIDAPAVSSESPTWTFPDLDCHPVTVRVERVDTPYNRLVLLWVPQREFFKRRIKIKEAA